MRTLIRARNRTVALERDRIVPEDGRFDLVLDFPDADVRPGLINSHEHLHRNHYGRLGRPTYPNAYEWARDIQSRYRRHIGRCQEKPRRAALLCGAWKNLFAGVTTLVHHDRWEPDFETGFPVRVVRVANADSLGMTPDAGEPRAAPFCIHVAEGVDDMAAREIDTLAERGLLDGDLIAVHGVGISEAGIDRFRASGAALVWCPTSNAFLFGRTAPTRLLAEGVDVLLGSDSLLTAAGNLLDELREARATHALSDDRLEAGIGETAAQRFGLAHPSLTPGAQADLLLLRRPLLAASAKDVELVLVGGVPRVARPDLAPRLSGHFPGGRPMTIGGVKRWTNDRVAVA